MDTPICEPSTNPIAPTTVVPTGYAKRLLGELYKYAPDWVATAIMDGRPSCDEEIEKKIAAFLDWDDRERLGGRGTSENPDDRAGVQPAEMAAVGRPTR